MTNRIEFEEIDGQIGGGSSGKMPLAIAGLAVAGDYTPKSFTRLVDALAHYVGGDLLESIAPQARDWKGPVVACRIECADVGEVTLDDDDWTGTSVPSVHTGATPIETAEYRIRIGTGATVGTAGATYFVSYDGGRTWGPETALGTADEITLAAAVGGIVIDLAAGTVVAGNVLVIHAVAPEPTAAEVSAAAEALGKFVADWECLEVSCPIDKTIASALDTAIGEMAARNRRPYWIANARLPELDETVAEYMTALSTEWSGYSTTRGAVVPGDCWYQSRVTLRTSRRPRVWGVAPFVERLPRQRDAAHDSNGVIAGMSLVDAEGNPLFHDEQIWPGFDAARFLTLWQDGEAGVRVHNPRLKSAPDSDYRYIQHRRVISYAEGRLYSNLRSVLHDDVIVSRKTGKPTPSYVRRVKAAAELALWSSMRVGPMASAIEVNPDENALILQTEEWSFELGVLPLGYTKWIFVKVKMLNPGVVEV